MSMTPVTSANSPNSVSLPLSPNIHEASSENNSFRNRIVTIIGGCGEVLMLLTAASSLLSSPWSAYKVIQNPSGSSLFHKVNLVITTFMIVASSKNNSFRNRIVTIIGGCCEVLMLLTAASSLLSSPWSAYKVIQNPSGSSLFHKVNLVIATFMTVTFFTCLVYYRFIKKCDTVVAQPRKQLPPPPSFSPLLPLPPHIASSLTSAFSTNHKLLSSGLLVNYKKLASHPEISLCFLNAHLRDKVPVFKIIDNQGNVDSAIDQGGVGRDVITTLMENLFSKPEYLKIFSTFTYHNEEKEGLFLCFNDRIEGNVYFEDDKEAAQHNLQAQSLITLGMIFGHAYRSFDLKIGNYFHTSLFASLKTLSSQEIKEISFNALIEGFLSDKIVTKITSALISPSLGGPLYKAIEKQNLSEDEKSTLSDYFDVEQQKLDSVELLHSSIKNLVWPVESVPHQQIALATTFIASGMLSVIGDYAWETMRQLTTEEIQDKIEGKISKEVVIEKITSHYEYPYYKDEPRVTFLLKWIEDCDETTLKKFVKAVTGSYNLGPKSQIAIAILEEHATKDISSHTCFNRIDIKKTITTQESFNDAMHIFITNASYDSGFGMA